ncbi:MAG: HU family DNA-binding protein [Phycisphaerales bacterium]|nr:HU family DNA-binding protein [Phycisphaerales bacterium]
MPTITKKELIDRIAVDTDLSRVQIKDVVQSLLDHIITELARDNRIELRDFGIFEPKQRAPRTAQNPRTLERVVVPARRTVKFKAGRLMQQSLAPAEGAQAEPKIVVRRPRKRPAAASVAAGNGRK